MPDKPDIEKAVFRAIDRVNELLPAGVELERSTSEPIAGPGSKLDSMGMVNFMTAVEEEVLREYGIETNLAETPPADGRHLLDTVGSLIQYLQAALRDPQ